MDAKTSLATSMVVMALSKKVVELDLDGFLASLELSEKALLNITHNKQADALRNLALVRRLTIAFKIVKAEYENGYKANNV